MLRTIRFSLIIILLILLLLLHIFSAVHAQEEQEELPIMTIGLVADNHYDTFPAGEKAPWQPMPHWLQEQIRRTTTPLKRRYDIAKDKMLEAADVFNRIADSSSSTSTENKKKSNSNSNSDMKMKKSSSSPLTFSVNLGDLVNNGLMWNTKPILDAFNSIHGPKYHIIGNHDLRSHNDRFGLNNKTQEKWLMSKFNVKEWFYYVDYPPFMNIFLDSMVMEKPESNPKRKQQLIWLKETLNKAKQLGRVVLIFGHISIGLQTSPFAPVLKEYPHIVGGFFGHHHKGGYVLQGNFHTTIIQGQIETLTNAFAVLEVFRDRMELTGFGRVPTRVMKFVNLDTVKLLKKFNGKIGGEFGKILEHGEEEGKEIQRGGQNQPLPPHRGLWSKEEVLQKYPSLNLNIPSYRKPLIPIADPNPGNTRFLKKVYSKWSRRVKTLAPEELVDLTSFYNSNNKNSEKENKKKRTWYEIRDGAHHIGVGNNNNNIISSSFSDKNNQVQKNNLKKDSSSSSFVAATDPPDFDPNENVIQKKQQQQGKQQQKYKNQQQQQQGIVEDPPDDDNSNPLGTPITLDDSILVKVEVMLISACLLICGAVSYRYRRLIGNLFG